MPFYHTTAALRWEIDISNHHAATCASCVVTAGLIPSVILVKYSMRVWLTHTWLADSSGTHKANKRDIRGAARLQGDRVNTEVLQHVKDGLKPKVLHSTLTILVQGQTEMLQGTEQSQTNKVNVQCFLENVTRLMSWEMLNIQLLCFIQWNIKNIF